MTIEELCAAAVEAGSNCAVTISTGPITPEHGTLAVIAVALFGVATVLASIRFFREI